MRRDRHLDTRGAAERDPVAAGLVAWRGFEALRGLGQGENIAEGHARELFTEGLGGGGRVFDGDMVCERQRHERRRRVAARDHDDLAQPRYAKSDVCEAGAGQVERIQRHLGRGLADGLRGDEADCLARCYERVVVLVPHDLPPLELVHLFAAVEVVAALFDEGLDELLVRLGGITQARGRIGLCEHDRSLLLWHARPLSSALVRGLAAQPLFHRFGQRLRRPLSQQCVGVHREEGGVLEVGHLGRVQAVLAGDKLHHALINARAHRMVVRDGQRLQVLDQAALQVARSRRLDRRVNQTLPPSHAVEVKLGGAYPGKETVGDVPASACGEVVRQEARRSGARWREGHSPAFELLLAEHDRDLREVDHGPFGASGRHEGEGVSRERHGLALGQALSDGVGGDRHQRALESVVELGPSLCPPLADGQHRTQRLAQFRVAAFVAVPASTPVVVNLLHGVVLHLCKRARSLGRRLVRRREESVARQIRLLGQDQVGDTASVPVHLLVPRQQPPQLREKQSRGCTTEKFMHRVHHAVL
mmetsp:Transcript_47486/g.103051  ORF Transcript_47486/g.103051 Transcript_47486/m.103051 type:complete len:533 (+) Transcript_47486:1687-3285(+)